MSSHNETQNHNVGYFFKKLRYLGLLTSYNSDSNDDMNDFQLELDELDPDPTTGFFNVKKVMNQVSTIFIHEECFLHDLYYDFLFKAISKM